ncbi:MAG TPA: hypothetical protein VGA08_01930 [Candidatus Saccharimonadales bacterium]
MNANYMLTLGRQPELSLAEIESVFGADNLVVAQAGVCLLKLAERPDIGRLGGSIKLGQVLASVGSVDELKTALHQHLPARDTKINVGLSWHGRLSPGEVGALGLQLKQAAKATGRKLRLVPNRQSALSAPQVVHNQLLEAGNVEFLAAEVDKKIVLAKTLAVQNVDDYSKRDFERPARDARVGMLPPKLAQIMLNLVIGQVRSSKSQAPNAKPPSPRILDPFCGTGVVLQEALLVGLSVYGTDIEPRMIEATKTNLNWLDGQYPSLISRLPAPKLNVADARNYSWQPPIDAVVSETYLGPPLSRLPNPSKLSQLVGESGQLLDRFLTNIKPQIAAGTPLVLAVPAWFDGPKLAGRSSVVDQIGALGYTRRRFETVKTDQLIYRRPDQVVGRELLVLRKS